MGDREPSSVSHRDLHWWHLMALVVLVVAVEGGQALMVGMPLSSILVALPHPLYAWCPIIAGVAISIRRADRSSTRAALALGVTVALLMVGLDAVVSVVPPSSEQAGAFTTRGFTSMGTNGAGTGWVRVVVDWSQGGLNELGEPLAPGDIYSDAHPRLRVAWALFDGSLVLLVFAVLGLVLAAGRWIRSHVTFSRSDDERAAHLVVAWLLTPMAVGLAQRQSEAFRFRALFGDGPLWAILLPPLAMLGVGIVAWLWSAKEPPSDDRSVPDEHELTDRTRSE